MWCTPVLEAAEFGGTFYSAHSEHEVRYEPCTVYGAGSIRPGWHALGGGPARVSGLAVNRDAVHGSVRFYSRHRRAPGATADKIGETRIRTEGERGSRAYVAAETSLRQCSQRPSARGGLKRGNSHSHAVQCQ